MPSSLFSLTFIMCLTATLVVADSTVIINRQKTGLSHETVTAYSALKFFLEDEQHLTTIRRLKMILTFSDISEHTTKLVDRIADTSTLAIKKIEKLATEKPAFDFIEFSDDTIAKATIDSLRMTTAKEFLFAGDEFEKDLLLSQVKILRVISHLSRQLEEKETNNKRKTWLKKLSEKYEKLYQQVNSRIKISG